MGTRRAQEEKLLIEKIQQKEPSALSTLYDRYQNILFGLIVQVIKVRPEVEDVLQEVFIKIWKKAHQFDSKKGTAFSWIVTIAKRTAIDRLRSRTSRSSKEVDNKSEDIDYSRHIDNGQDSPQDVVEAQQKKEAISKALEKIPEEQRILIVISFFEGKTHTEISELLNIPLGTVKSRIRLGMIKLQSILANKESLVTE